MTERETLARVLAAQDNMVGGPEGEFSVMAWQMQMAKIAAAYARADAILASDWLASVRAEAERAGMMRAAALLRGKFSIDAEARAGEVIDAIADAIRQAAPAGETADERQGWRDIASDPPPHACHVLACRWDGYEWVMDVVSSPPKYPFTDWRPLPTPPAKEPRDG